MDTELDYQIAIDEAGQVLPTHLQIETWIDAVFEACARWDKNQVTVRVVDEDEMTQLNEDYRQKQGSTNVLSFPFEAPEQIEVLLLGDIVICAPVVEREALEQNKSVIEHWAHMVVHGSLHLLGYDHITEEQAQKMETLEIETLSVLGFKNPYLDLEFCGSDNTSKTSTKQMESK